MKIGLFDADGHNFPNLPLMKLSAWHKAQGDNVEFVFPLEYYDRVYVSKVFGDEYTKLDTASFNAYEIILGGTGFAITIEDGKEVYHKDRDPNFHTILNTFTPIIRSIRNSPRIQHTAF